MHRLALLLVAASALAGCPRPVAWNPSAPVDVSGWSVDREALPGGTLRALHVASTGSRERMIIEGGGSSFLVMPVHAYLFEHPTEGPVMIDTGFGRRTAADPYDYPGRMSAQLLHLRMGPDGPVADRLPEVGIAPDDVKHVVVTHMHSDHIGGLEDLPRAVLWVSRAEWEAAGERGPFGKPDTRPFSDHEHVRTVDYTATGPYGPFEGHVDVFGDGTVIMLPSPGHTVGHTSVLVNLKGGSILFTGDCAWIDRHWQEELPKGALVRSLLEPDPQLNQEALGRVRRWAAAFPDEILVVAGHEPANVERLKPWPLAYE
jgi:glyoxylase-like metal-dependent hydrolase (beta-lactamase superfamily II)